MPERNTTISFNRPVESGEDNLTSLSLDTKYNTSVYGQTKSTFAPGESAYLQLSPGGGVYSMASSAGTIVKAAKNIPYDKEDILTFANQSTAELSALPLADVVWNWIGKKAGSPLFSGRTVTLNSPATAVLHCVYQEAGDRLKLTVTSTDMMNDDEIIDEMDVLVSVSQGDQTVSTSVNFTRALNVGPVPVDIEVKNFCDDSLIVDAEVFIDGSSKGKTNANGLVYAGMLTPGVTYHLSVVKDGFIPNAEDVLSNDTFIISSTAVEIE